MKVIIVLLILAGAGYFFYQQDAASGGGTTPIKVLLDRVDASPVEFPEAHAVFKDAVVQLCTINAGDTAHGFGTAEECIGRMESYSDQMCLQKLSTRAGGKYSSSKTLKDDFSIYVKCVMRDVDKTGK